MNPFLGTWVANLEKSRRHANHQFQSATLTFEVSAYVSWFIVAWLVCGVRYAMGYSRWGA
jgi:hypothetical protein